MIYGDTAFPARFWAKVYPEPNTGCWLWGASHNGSGYGEFVLGVGRKRYAHRLMCATAHGAPPADKKFALHSCDVGSCVNPQHLRWGTNKENTADMLKRGRHVTPWRKQ